MYDVHACEESVHMFVAAHNICMDRSEVDVNVGCIPGSFSTLLLECE